MRIFFDRNVEPRYIAALQDAPFTTECLRSDDRFPPDAPDHELAQFADENSYVVFTRDNDFFQLVNNDFDCGLLYFHPNKPTTPGDIRSAVEEIAEQYPDHSEILEALPGTWV